MKESIGTATTLSKSQQWPQHKSSTSTRNAKWHRSNISQILKMSLKIGFSNLKTAACSDLYDHTLFKDPQIIGAIICLFFVTDTVSVNFFLLNDRFCMSRRHSLSRAPIIFSSNVSFLFFSLMNSKVKQSFSEP